VRIDHEAARRADRCLRVRARHPQAHPLAAVARGAGASALRPRHGRLISPAAAPAGAGNSASGFRPSCHLLPGEGFLGPGGMRARNCRSNPAVAHRWSGSRQLGVTAPMLGCAGVSGILIRFMPVTRIFRCRPVGAAAAGRGQPLEHSVLTGDPHARITSDDCAQTDH
jgi:hypothetical protein